MKNLLVLLVLLTIFNGKNYSQSASKDECFTCHNDLGGEPVEQYKKGVHFKLGIACSACHGGNSKTDDMDVAMSKEAGFKGVPKGNTISETCASCHSFAEKMASFGSHIKTTQFESLKESVHGKLSTNGNERIVQCTTCHGVHEIVSVKNPSSPVYPLNIPKLCSSCHSNPNFMRTYNPGLPIDQLQKYRSSVHGILNGKGDPKPAQCVSCHGNHDIKAVKDVNSKVYPVNIPKTCSNCHSNKEYMKQYKIPTDQYEKYSVSVHGIALLEKKDLGAPACNNCHGNHAATPPGISSISKVCGTCHVLNADLFSESPHKKVFDQNKFPECETCHGKHEIITASNKLLGITRDAVCTKCHTPEKSVKGYEVAKEMRILVDSLDRDQKTAQDLINQAEQKGMEVAEAKFKLRDAKQAVLETRTIVHSFDQKKFDDVVDKGLSVTSDVKIEAQAAIDEYFFRRFGLVAAIFIISILAISLYLFIKKYEKTQKRNI